MASDIWDWYGSTMGQYKDIFLGAAQDSHELGVIFLVVMGTYKDGLESDRKMHISKIN